MFDVPHLSISIGSGPNGELVAVFAADLFCCFAAGGGNGVVVAFAAVDAFACDRLRSGEKSLISAGFTVFE